MEREYKINLKGQKFGRLTVTEKIGTRKKPCGKTIMIWRCQCDCGNITEANTSALRSGEKRSCGCLRKERKIKYSPAAVSRQRSGFLNPSPQG